MAQRVYLDYASTTPTDPKVLKAMLPYLKGSFANPASLYKEGVEMKKVIEGSKKTIGAILHAHTDELYFTSSGTEANNLTILGIYEAYIAKSNVKPHVITTTIEHASVLEVFKEIEKKGGEVTYLPVTEEGLVDPKELKKSLRKNTLLVSIHYANNEIGTIEPIRELAKTIRHYKKEHNQVIYFHTDASQAANYCDLNTELLGVDAMTLDSSKIYGTKGVGLVYIRRRTDINPIMFGGGQENGLRPGTENVAGIVGMTEALKIAQMQKEKEGKRLSNLRDDAISSIVKLFPHATLNGHPTERLPNNINICFPDLDAEFAVFRLDAKGIACSSVTSCKNLTEDSSSYVIEAIGKPECSKSSLRISLGRFTKKSDISFLLKTLKMLK